MRIGYLILIIFFSMFSLSGCGDRLELEKQAFVVAIGLDKGEEENMVNVTFQISNPQVNTSQVGESQMETPADIITITAPDIFSAKSLVQSSHSRKINFSHLEAIIVGEDLAKSELFQHIIGSAIIDSQMRRGTFLIVSKEKANAFIHANKPMMETRPHKYYEFMEERWKDNGFVPLAHLNNLFQRIEGELFLAIYATAERNEHVKKDEDEYVAGEVPQRSGDPVQMMGAAVMKNRKMVGTMNGEEVRLSLLLRRKTFIRSITTSFTDPIRNDFRITTKLNRRRNPKIKINTDQEPVQITVKVPLTIQVPSNPALVTYTKNQKRQKQLKNLIEAELKKSSNQFIERLQNEFGSEPFKWYAIARKNFRTTKQFSDYRWEEKFKRANVDITYDVKIENFGEQIRLPKLEKAEE